MINNKEEKREKYFSKLGIFADGLTGEQLDSLIDLLNYRDEYMHFDLYKAANYKQQ